MGGFSIVPLAQKARTKTLIADSDLNLGNYDLIATDVKGDTSEFTEFVGGVGNFSNVLGSGNLDIEGTASIKGNTQIDGNLMLEGALNNVNIYNGRVTASGGFDGDLKGFVFIGGTVSTSGTDIYAEANSASSVLTNYYDVDHVFYVSPADYSITYPLIKQHVMGVYTRRTDITNTDIVPSLTTRNIIITNSDSSAHTFRYFTPTAGIALSQSVNGNSTFTISCNIGDTYRFYAARDVGSYFTVTLENAVKYYVEYNTP